MRLFFLFAAVAAVCILLLEMLLSSAMLYK